MQEIKVEFPIILNGLFITEEVYTRLSWFQTADTLGYEKPKYNNEGIIGAELDISKAIVYLLYHADMKSLDESKEEELGLAISLQWIVQFLRDFKVPDEFVTFDI